VDRRPLAEFLRSRRDRLQPGEAGLSAGSRRRTPGLRREEVARLAAISVDYYTRLEQARGPRPSRQVLSALARALRLSAEERAHLFHLAGDEPQRPAGPPQDVPAGIAHLLERLDDTPAFVMDASYTVLAWNSMAAALIVDFSALAKRDRNMIRWACRRGLRDESALEFARSCVAQLRVAAGRYPDDPGIKELISEVHSSPELAAVWAEHDVSRPPSTTKWLNHPVVGPIELYCDVLHIPEADQHLVLYTAAPGTAAYEALRLLKVVGLQDLRPDRGSAEQRLGDTARTEHG